MKTTTTVRSWSAIIVGIAFTVITAWVLCEDTIRHGAPFTNRHLMSLSVLGGAVFFGHQFWREWSEERFGNSLGCAVLFLAGTLFCVLSSAGRNAEVTTTKVMHANAQNVARELAARDVSEAQARHTAALANETNECAKSAYSNLCYVARTQSEIRRKQYDDAKRALARERPLQVANADIRAAAELLSKLPIVGGNLESVEATLLLVFPFLLALFCEIAAICGFAIGLGHKVAALSLPESGKQRTRRTPDEELVLAALHAAGRPLSSEELAQAMSVSPGEGTKRRQVCEASGVIRTWRDGKYLMIAPATLQ